MKLLTILSDLLIKFVFAAVVLVALAAFACLFEVGSHDFVMRLLNQ